MGWPAKAWVPKSGLELLVWTVGAIGSPCYRGLCLWEPWGFWGGFGMCGVQARGPYLETWTGSAGEWYRSAVPAHVCHWEKLHSQAEWGWGFQTAG